ncbi:Transcription termination/antitermination factor NusG [Candidatus Bandiella woodruffii]|uniref:Transcription termination/antitermination protein NusG n=1 Tax=Candidatus Bandiella euplotis TaxID=1664265 RepID=A0ABZ0UPU4_9RICK|nr:Transcription termination/antitermination factor NusG [Candidatus Bandiella woodruffii]
MLSGYEKKAIELIRQNAQKKEVDHLFEDFVIPVEHTLELKKGKKVDSEKKIFPGYVLVNMELNDLTWNIVKNTQYVGKLLGGGNRPLPIPEHEIKRVLKQVEEGKVVKERKKTFEIGENVRIINGVFETFNGIVEEVDDEKQRLKILVSIFGRETPVELEFEQVEKINN